MKVKTFNKIASEGLDLIRENFSGSEVSEDVSDPDAILLRSHKLQIEECKGVRAVARAGAGVNNVPVEALSEHGVVVFNTPGANANAVAELTIGAMISQARNMYSARNYFGQFQGYDEVTCDIAKQVEGDKKQFKGSELRGKKLVVIGLGAIGARVVKLAQAFEMRVVGIDPYVNSLPQLESVENWEEWKADYYSFHVPVVEETKKVASRVLEVAQRDGAAIFNFARGELFNAGEILVSLQAGLAAYVTDFADNILAVPVREGLVCYPHIGASTEEAETNCSVMAATQLCDFFQYGRITNSVNFPELPYIAPEEGVVRFVVLHRNIPGALKRITEYIADGLQANVKDMINRSKGAYAATLIDLENVEEKPDAAFNSMLCEELQDVLGVFRVNLAHQP